MDQKKALEELKKDILAAHDEKLAESGMVYILFADGEISLTKAGSLLWQRTLHMLSPGVKDLKLPIEFPASCSGFGLIFTTHETAKKLAKRIFEFFGQDVPYNLKETSNAGK
jgi:hypothetical protein